MLELLKTDYTLQIVALGSALLGISSGIVGSFSVLKRQSLIGDAVSHAALPGIALAFILFQTKNTLFFMLGALLSGLLAVYFINSVDNYSRIKYDSALALILSVFFGIGLVLMTYIQKIPNSNQSGLDKFIFGQASTMLRREVDYLLVVSIVLLGLILIFWKELKIYVFNPEYGESIGFSRKKVGFLLSGMVVAAIIIGLQTVGVILMSAMLIAPGVAARQWTDRLSVMVLLAGFFGGFSGLVGTIISSLIEHMPTGPTIVVIISLFVVLSLGFAPHRGLLWTKLKESQNRRNLHADKILLNLYRLSKNHQRVHGHQLQAIKPLSFPKHKGDKIVLKQLNVLADKGLVTKQKDFSGRWLMTEMGNAYVEGHPVLGEVNGNE